MVRINEYTKSLKEFPRVKDSRAHLYAILNTVGEFKTITSRDACVHMGKGNQKNTCSAFACMRMRLT